MKKTFQEKLWEVIQERHSSDDEAGKKRHLKEASSPAAQTLMTYIQQWNFGSCNIALGRLLECDRWTDKGTLVLECDHKGKPYPAKGSSMTSIRCPCGNSSLFPSANG